MPGKAAEKGVLRRWLALGDQAAVLDHLATMPAQRAVTLLLGLLAEADEDVRMLAVSALGQVVRGLAANDLEAARQTPRRLLWSLNEESGAVPWGAPEALGEIMAQDVRLAGEYVNLLISFIWTEGNYLEFPPLQAGVAWGLGRLAQADVSLPVSRGAVGPLLALVDSPDAQVRGACAWALGQMAASEAAPALRRLLTDAAPCRLFDGGAMRPTTVGALAAESLARLANVSAS